MTPARLSALSFRLDQVLTLLKKNSKKAAINLDDTSLYPCGIKPGDGKLLEEDSNEVTSSGRDEREAGEDDEQLHVLPLYQLLDETNHVAEPNYVMPAHTLKSKLCANGPSPPKKTKGKKRKRRNSDAAIGTMKPRLENDKAQVIGNRSLPSFSAFRQMHNSSQHHFQHGEFGSGKLSLDISADSAYVPPFLEATRDVNNYLQMKNEVAYVDEQHIPSMFSHAWRGMENHAIKRATTLQALPPKRARLRHVNDFKPIMFRQQAHDFNFLYNSKDDACVNRTASDFDADREASQDLRKRLGFSELKKESTFPFAEQDAHHCADKINNEVLHKERTLPGNQVKHSGDFVTKEMGGVAIALEHGSILIECAKKEVHATTPLRNPQRKNPTRLSIIFYQHKQLNIPNHGYERFKLKMNAKQQRQAEEKLKSENAQNDVIKKSESGTQAPFSDLQLLADAALSSSLDNHPQRDVIAEAAATMASSRQQKTTWSIRSQVSAFSPLRQPPDDSYARELAQMSSSYTSGLNPPFLPGVNGHFSSPARAGGKEQEIAQAPGFGDFRCYLSTNDASPSNGHSSVDPALIHRRLYPPAQKSLDRHEVLSASDRKSFNSPFSVSSLLGLERSQGMVGYKDPPVSEHAFHLEQMQQQQRHSKHAERETSGHFQSPNAHYDHHWGNPTGLNLKHPPIAPQSNDLAHEVWKRENTDHNRLEDESVALCSKKEQSKRHFMIHLKNKLGFSDQIDLENRVNGLGTSEILAAGDKKESQTDSSNGAAFQVFSRPNGSSSVQWNSSNGNSEVFRPQQPISQPGRGPVDWKLDFPAGSYKPRHEEEAKLPMNQPQHEARQNYWNRLEADSVRRDQGFRLFRPPTLLQERRHEEPRPFSIALQNQLRHNFNTRLKQAVDKNDLVWNTSRQIPTDAANTINANAFLTRSACSYNPLFGNTRPDWR